MVQPDPEVLAWASAVLGSEVTVIRSLRLGGPPWLLRAGLTREVMLERRDAFLAAALSQLGSGQLLTSWFLRLTTPANH